MFTVIYEIDKITPNYGPIIVAPVFWGLLIAVLRERYFVKDSEFYKASRVKYLTWLFTLLLFGSFTTTGIFRNLKREKIISELLSGTLKDKSGRPIKLQICEGYVENFVYGSRAKKGGESFYINGLRFGYTNNGFYGYGIYANDGGVIKPGRYLRLHYIYFDSFYGRMIFKIEEDIEKTNQYSLLKQGELKLDKSNPQKE